MAESDLQPDIFNSRYFGRENSPAPCRDLEFPLFARLPHEIRHQIWTCHLPRCRCLRVLLEENTGSQHGEEPEHNVGDDDDDDEWAPLFVASPKKPDALSSHASGLKTSLIRVTFLGDPSPAMPALRQVCREAREAHNSVYRIRIRALARIPRGYDYTTKRVVAYLSPELDMLSIHTPNPPEIVTLNLLPLFLHHLVQHDFSPAPLRFGVRHLCVDLRQLSSEYHHGADDGGGPAPLAPEVLASVRLAVLNLRGLYLRLTTAGHLEPRVMSGPFVNTISCPWYNASFPVVPAASWGFDNTMEPLSGGDPRLALPKGKADLHQVWIGDELRPSLDVWAGLERAWGVPACSTRNRVVRALLGLDAEDWAEERMARGGRISSLGAYMSEERAAWKSLMDPTSEMGATLRQIFQRPADLPPKRPRPAVSGGPR